MEEFYVAPSAKSGDESVDETIYASSGKYIDPVSFIKQNQFLIK